MKPPPPREGTRLIRALIRRRGRDYVAKRIGVTEVAVRHWADERRSPAARPRIALLKEFGIPIEAWDGPADAAAVPAKGAAKPKGPIEPVGATVSAKELVLDQVNRLRERVLDPEEPRREQLERAFTAACRLYSRLNQELEINEHTLLRSSAWQKTMRVIREVMANHPVAARELEARLLTLANT